MLTGALTPTFHKCFQWLVIHGGLHHDNMKLGVDEHGKERVKSGGSRQTRKKLTKKPLEGKRIQMGWSCFALHNLATVFSDHVQAEMKALREKNDKGTQGPFMNEYCPSNPPERPPTKTETKWMAEGVSSFNQRSLEIAGNPAKLPRVKNTNVDRVHDICAQVFQSTEESHRASIEAALQDRDQ